MATVYYVEDRNNYISYIHHGIISDVNKCLKEFSTIKRGDLVCFTTDEYRYRNENVLIYDGDKLIELYGRYDEYGHVPDSFVVNDTNFAPNYWVGKIWHNSYFFPNSDIRQRAVDAITYGELSGFKEPVHYSRFPIGEKIYTLIFDHYTHIEEDDEDDEDDEVSLCPTTDPCVDTESDTESDNKDKIVQHLYEFYDLIYNRIWEYGLGSLEIPITNDKLDYSMNYLLLGGEPKGWSL